MYFFRDLPDFFFKKLILKHLIKISTLISVEWERHFKENHSAKHFLESSAEKPSGKIPSLKLSGGIQNKNLSKKLPFPYPLIASEVTC